MTIDLQVGDEVIVTTCGPDSTLYLVTEITTIVGFDDKFLVRLESTGEWPQCALRLMHRSNKQPDIVSTVKPTLITDHGYRMGHGGVCIYVDEGGTCGAEVERHATCRNMRGMMWECEAGIVSEIYPKPQRERPARHETRSWAPYGEIDLLCEDSE